jgi:hypothetical protein
LRGKVVSLVIEETALHQVTRWDIEDVHAYDLKTQKDIASIENIFNLLLNIFISLFPQ